jgi:hypothetical protein
MPSRRFPPPWTVDELEACFVVRDHNGQQLAYVYFEDEPGRRDLRGLVSPAAPTLVAVVWDGIAQNIVRRSTVI